MERERRENVAAFIGAVVDCTGVYARKLFSPSNPASLEDITLADNDTNPETRQALAKNLVIEQWQKLWDETFAGDFRLPEHVLGAAFGKALDRLHHVDSTLFDAAWNPLSLRPFNTYKDTLAKPVILLSSISARFESSDLQSYVASLVVEWLNEVNQLTIFDAQPLDVDNVERSVDTMILLMQYFNQILLEDPTLNDVRQTNPPNFMITLTPAM